MRKKVDEISKYLESFDIITLTETWIENKQINAMENKLDMNYNWKWIEAVREKARGRPAGGLLVGTRNGIETSGFKGNSKGCWAAIKVKLNNKWINIFSVYNNTKSGELRKELEDELEEARLRGEDSILGGDLNARIGTMGSLEEEEEERSTMDKVVDEEGERWMELLDTYNIGLLNGNINGDTDGNYTRLGYKHQEESVLDYAGISRDALSLVETFKVGNEGYSDHSPLEVTLNTTNDGQPTPVKVKQIWNHTTKDKYTREMAKVVKGDNWEELRKQFWTASTRKSMTNSRRNVWWNGDCYKARITLKNACRSMRAGTGNAESWREAKREYRTTIKSAKEAQSLRWRDELDAVHSLSEGWNFIRKYTVKGNRGHRPPIGRLREHYRQLLEGTPITPATRELAPVEHIQLEEYEMVTALAHLKERKAAGPDGLTAESLKYADKDSHRILHNLIEDILNGKPVPQSWCESTLWPVHKKGDRENPANYRGIAIGNSIYKLLAQIVGTRLRQYVEDHDILPDSQNGFRAKRSTIDNVAILNKCIQQCLGEEQGKLFTLFVDFKTAFDCIDRTLLFATLRSKGIPDYLVNTIVAMYEQTSYLIEGESFRSHKGLKQGCPLSPLLFAIYIADMDETLRRNQIGGLVVGGKKIYSLAFADDITLLARDAPALKDMIKALHRYEKRKHLEINVAKSKVLVFSKGSRVSGTEWKVGLTRTYEEVEEFVYLGVTMQRNGNYTRHHNTVTRKANRRATEVWSLAERLFPHAFSVRMQMFRTLVVPILLYGAEVTGYSECEQYEAIQRRYTRWTMGLPKSSRIVVLEKEANLEPVRIARLKRAFRYEARNHVSPLLRATQIEPLANRHLWARQRSLRINELGWGAEEGLERLRGEENFWSQLVERARDQHIQVMTAGAAKVGWYWRTEEPPRYLRGPSYKMIARLRCGAETRAEDGWRAEVTCRVCGQEKETMRHVVQCAGVKQGGLAEGEKESVEVWRSYVKRRVSEI